MFHPNNDFQVGDRIEMHPATDAWMMGDRYGEIIKKTHTLGRNRTRYPFRYHVKLDKSGRTTIMSSSLITLI